MEDDECILMSDIEEEIEEEDFEDCDTKDDNIHYGDEEDDDVCEEDDDDEDNEFSFPRPKVAKQPPQFFGSPLELEPDDDE